MIVEQCRKLINVHQFNNEPQRILLASLASGLRPTDSFISSTLQKHLFREMKLADTAMKNKEMLRWNPLNKRYAPVFGTSNRAGDGDDALEEDAEDIARDESVSEGTSGDRANLPEIPTKNNPITVAIYGQICMAAKSYQSAICSFSLIYCSVATECFFAQSTCYMPTIIAPTILRYVCAWQ